MINVHETIAGPQLQIIIDWRKRRNKDSVVSRSAFNFYKGDLHCEIISKFSNAMILLCFWYRS